MFGYLILIGLSFAMPPLFFFTIPFIIYRIATVQSRRKKYHLQAITWRTGGLLRTGDINIHRAIDLYKKSSNLGCSEASEALGDLYSTGWSHPNSGRLEILPNKTLSNLYYRKSERQECDFT